MKIDSLTKSRISTFCHDYKIDLFIIFGSFVTEKTHPTSDIDIALLINSQSNQIDKLNLIFELEGIFERQVDLVILSPTTDPLLRYEIFFSGKPIYMTDKNLFEENKLYAWKIYMDTKKIRYMRQLEFKKKIGKLKDEFRSYQS